MKRMHLSEFGEHRLLFKVPKVEVFSDKVEALSERLKQSDVRLATDYLDQLPADQRSNILEQAAKELKTKKIEVQEELHIKTNLDHLRNRIATASATPEKSEVTSASTPERKWYDPRRWLEKKEQGTETSETSEKKESIFFPNTFDPRKWSNTQIATLSLLTGGGIILAVGARRLWNWFRGKKPDNQQSGVKHTWGVRNWIFWIPVVGLAAAGIGTAAYYGHHYMLRFELYGNLIENLNKKVNSIAKWGKENIPGLAKGKGEKYGISEEQYKKAENSYKKKGKDARAEIEEIFGVKAGEQNMHLVEQFMGEMEEIHQGEMDPDTGIRYIAASEALQNYEKDVGTAILELGQLLENHAFHVLVGSMLAAKLGVLDDILKASLSTTEKAVRLAAAMTRFGIKHPFLSIFAMGSTILALKATKDTVRLPQNLYELSSACFGNKEIARGSKDLVASVFNALQEQVRKLGPIAEDFGAWVKTQAQSLFDELKETLPNAFGLTEEEIIQNNNEGSMDSLRHYLDIQLRSAETSEELRNKIGLKCERALKLLEEFGIAFITARCTDNNNSDKAPDLLNDLEKALADLGIALTRSNGKVRWQTKDMPEAFDLCVDPSIKDKKTLKEISQKLQHNEHFATYLLWNALEQMREREQKGMEKWGGGAVGMVLGNFLYVVEDWRNPLKYFMVPVDLAFDALGYGDAIGAGGILPSDMRKSDDWTEWGANLTTATLTCALTSIGTGAVAHLKRLAIGGGPLWKGRGLRIAMNVVPGASQYTAIRSMWLASKEIQMVRKFGLIHGRQVNNALYHAGIKADWAYLVETTKDPAILKQIGQAVDAKLLGPDPEIWRIEVRAKLQKLIGERVKDFEFLDIPKNIREGKLFHWYKAFAKKGVNKKIFYYQLALNYSDAKTLFDAGADVGGLYMAGAKLDELIALGADLGILLKAHAPVDGLLKAGATVDDLVAAGAKIDDLIKAGVSVLDLLKAGVQEAKLLQAGIAQTVIDQAKNALKALNQTPPLVTPPPQLPPKQKTPPPLPKQQQAAQQGAQAATQAPQASAGSPATNSAVSQVSNKAKGAAIESNVAGKLATEGTVSAKLAEALKTSSKAEVIMEAATADVRLGKLLEESPALVTVLTQNLEKAGDAKAVLMELKTVANAPDVEFVSKLLGTEQGSLRLLTDLEKGGAPVVLKTVGNASKVSKIMSTLKVAGRVAPVAIDALVIYGTVVEIMDKAKDIEECKKRGVSEEIIRMKEQEYYYLGAQLGVGGVSGVAGLFILAGVGTTVAWPVVLATLPIGVAISGEYAAHQLDTDFARTPEDWAKEYDLVALLTNVRSFDLREIWGGAWKLMDNKSFDQDLMKWQRVLGPFAPLGKHGERFASGQLKKDTDALLAKIQAADENKIRGIIMHTTTVTIPTEMQEANGTTRKPNKTEMKPYQEALKRYVEAKVSFFMAFREDAAHATRSSGHIIDILEGAEHAGQLAKNRPQLEAEYKQLIADAANPASQKRAAAIRKILDEKDVKIQAKEYGNFLQQEQITGLYATMLIQVAMQDKANRASMQKPLENAVTGSLMSTTQHAYVNFCVQCQEDDNFAWGPDGNALTVMRLYAAERMQEIAKQSSGAMVTEIMANADEPNEAGSYQFEIAMTKAKADIERFLADSPQGVWDNMPKETKGRLGYKFVDTSAEAMPEKYKARIEEGEKLMSRIGAHYHGTHYTKRFGIPYALAAFLGGGVLGGMATAFETKDKKYFFITFNRAKGKWMATLGDSNLEHAVDPSTLQIVDRGLPGAGGAAKFNKLLEALDAINKGEKPLL